MIYDVKSPLFWSFLKQKTGSSGNSRASSPWFTPSPERRNMASTVGVAFACQYYQALHQTPELVHKFYKDVSKLVRPDAEGSLRSITTIGAIKQRLMSLEYSASEDELYLRTVNVQESYNGGVLVLVTGSLTRKDNITRNFTQAFFLAPQKGGYFVLNDIFMYLDASNQQQQGNEASFKGREVTGLYEPWPLPHKHDSLQSQEQWNPEQAVSPLQEGEEVNVGEACKTLDNDGRSLVDEPSPVTGMVDQVTNNSKAVLDSSPATIQEEAPKKSYSSVVKIMKENAAPLSVPTASPFMPASMIPERHAVPVLTPSPTHEAPNSCSHASESANVLELEGNRQWQGNEASFNGCEVIGLYEPLPIPHEHDSPHSQEQRNPEQAVSPPQEGEEANVDEVCNSSDGDEGSLVDEPSPVIGMVDQVPNNSKLVVDSSPATFQEEAPKKSYGSIVKVMKENAAPLSVPTAPRFMPASMIPERQAAPVLTPSSTPEPPDSGSHASESAFVQDLEDRILSIHKEPAFECHVELADGYLIYIKNLPLTATPVQLEKEFKRFGPIKPGGIQVRSDKQQGFCFGFVEFEVESAVQNAIEASPIVVGGDQAYVEEQFPSQ